MWSATPSSSASPRRSQEAKRGRSTSCRRRLRGHWSSIDAFRGEGPLAAWVWRILVNTSRNEARPRELPGAASEQNGPQPESSSRGDELGVRRWVASLPERQRLAIFLRYYGDCDYRAIAAALDVEVGTVSATLNAAHTALRRMLKEVPS